MSSVAGISSKSCWWFLVILFVFLLVFSGFSPPFGPPVKTART